MSNFDENKISRDEQGRFARSNSLYDGVVVRMTEWLRLT